MCFKRKSGNGKKGNEYMNGFSKEEALEFYNDYMEEYADELALYGIMQEMQRDKNMLEGNDDE